MNRAKGLKLILAPLVILILLPLLVIALFKFGKNEYKPLPYIGNSLGVAPNGDTMRHTIPEFSLTDQFGKAYGSKDLEGKIYVANFFFSRCPNICPVITKNLKTIERDYSKKSDLHIVSFTLDPKFDTAEVLANYAKRFDIQGDKWHFLTGPRPEIFRLMNQEGFLVVQPFPSDDPDQFQHSEIIVLVDKEGHIRGQYDGTKAGDIKNLSEDIGYLYYSYANPGK